MNRPRTRDIVGIDPEFTGDETTVDYVSRRRGMTFPGDQSSPDAGGAVGEPAVTSSAPSESGDLVRRRQPLVDALYHQNSAVAELLAGMESVCADLDDDTLSGGLWSLQQACLRFDRDLRVRRR